MTESRLVFGSITNAFSFAHNLFNQMIMTVKKHHFFIYPIIILLLLFCNCQKDPKLIEFQIGKDLINTDSRISICDTFLVELSNVLFDSMTTSNTDSLLIGQYADDRLGIINSKCYFRVKIPTSVTIQEGDVFDSISLVVKLNGYSYGDTTKKVNWNVYRLSEMLKLNENGYLYNMSSFKYFDDPIGEVSFKPYPSKTQEINIPIDHNLGNTLFDMVINRDEKVESDENFFNYFNGITIAPSNTDLNNLLGVTVNDTSLVMRIYAHRDEEEKVDIELDFGVETGELPFSQITCNRASTIIESLTKQQYSLSSTLTNNESYIQGGTGIMTRVDIPELMKIQEAENTLLMKAELILYPIVGTYQTPMLPSKLVFYKCNKLNEMEYNYTNETTNESIYGTINIGTDLYNESTYYSIDITKYIKDELSDKYFEPGLSGLLLYYDQPGYLVTASRLVFGNYYHKNYPAKLKLYFLKYN
jgi:hypothetical protein